MNIIPRRWKFDVTCTFLSHYLLFLYDISKSIITLSLLKVFQKNERVTCIGFRLTHPKTVSYNIINDMNTILSTMFGSSENILLEYFISKFLVHRFKSLYGLAEKICWWCQGKDYIYYFFVSIVSRFFFISLTRKAVECTFICTVAQPTMILSPIEWAGDPRRRTMMVVRLSFDSTSQRE